MSPEQLTALVTSLFGAGGLGSIIIFWLKNRAGQVPEDAAKRVEAQKVQETAAVSQVGTDIVEQWRQTVEALQAQNASLAEQNAVLWENNKHLIEQNTMLRRQLSSGAEALSEAERQQLLALSYIDDLRLHIRYQNPPPAPPWPDGLERVDYRSNPPHNV